MTDKLRVEGLAKVFGPEPESAVELARKGVSKDEIFKRTASIVAVDNVSFAVPEREIFVVMGLSGSGKSTLIRCLNRLIEPTSGHVFIDDDEVTGVDAEALRQIRLSKMAMVFQHFALLPHRTVAENAAFGLKLRGMAAAERRRRALEALDAVGLAAWADSPPDALSGGMQQRVGLARALAVEPEILLMDEPFSALDPLIRRDMQDELLKLQERYRTTIVFITHDLHEALKIGDQVAIMKDGVFVQVSGPEAIVNAPSDDYVSAFVEDVDRSRVLTLRSVMREIEPLRLDGKATIAAAQARFAAAAIDGLPVVDAEGRLEGVVMRRAIERAGGKGDLAGCFSGKGASASADQLVHEALPAMAELAKAGSVLSVVDEEGRVVGVVEPATVLGELGAQSTPESRETAHG